MAISKIYSNLDLLNVSKIVNLPAPSDVFDATNKGYVDMAIDSALAGLDFQKDILAVQTDATLDPGAESTIGDRYIIANSAALHTNFGTIAGLEDNDIVEYDGSQFIVEYDVSIKGSGALAWNKGTTSWYRFNTSWTEFGGLSSTSGGAALTKTGEVLDVNVDNVTIEIKNDQLVLKDGAVSALKLGVDVAGAGLGLNATTNALDINAGNGLQIAEDNLTLKLDGVTLTNSADGLKVTDNAFISKLGTSIVDNFVTFSDTTGAVKDSGKSVNGITYKFAGNVPAGTAGNTITIEHNLETEDVIVSVKEIATKTNVEFVECTIVDANSLTLKFNVDVVADTFKCVVIG